MNRWNKGVRGADMAEQFQKLLDRKAAALKYDPDRNGAPVVVASGMGYAAEKITETAMKAGVPVYEDDSLASVLTRLKMGTEIPPELYQAVVEIYVYFLGFTGEEGEDQKRREEEEIRRQQMNRMLESEGIASAPENARRAGGTRGGR